MRRFLLLFVLAGTALAAAGRAAETAPAAPLTREDFIAQLAADLSSHFNLEGDLELELLRPWSAPDRLARSWSMVVSDYPTVLSANLLVRCRLLADGDAAGDYTVTLRAALWRDAWAARQPVTANGAFEPAQLEARRVDFLRERDALPASVGDHSYIFVRGVSPGRLLTWHDIARRPLVRKGDYVEVAAIDGLLSVTMKGLAMENGAAGDTVTIRNPDSRKDFSAQVVAENRVQIRF
jgi:flagella basal body P-ring formation protein FlgA